MKAKGRQIQASKRKIILKLHLEYIYFDRFNTFQTPGRSFMSINKKKREKNVWGRITRHWPGSAAGGGKSQYRDMDFSLSIYAQIYEKC